MFNIIKHPEWYEAERVTPEQVYWKRRDFIKQLGFAGTGLLATTLPGKVRPEAQDATKGYPYPRQPKFDPDWKLTNEEIAGTYNNFYEFTTVKDLVHKLTFRFKTEPWPINISGLIENPMKIDVGELIDTMPMEERVYRFRCVEAWSMIVPWTGFEFNKLIEKVKPKPEAKFVRFKTFFRPQEAPGFQQRGYPWPYTEGLRLDEAMNPLTLVATGIYGKPMPKQHGAPIRMVVPWKYGYKSVKSIDTIEFVSEQPKTLWESLAPDEYPFESNVDPNVPHPRWSQATERRIDTGLRVRTKVYNGYGDSVAHLYSKG